MALRRQTETHQQVRRRRCCGSARPNYGDTALSIASDLIQIMNEIGARIAIPPIRRVFVAPTPERPACEEFGLLVLEDGSTGLFYLLLGDTWERMQAQLRLKSMFRRHPLELIGDLESSDELARTLAMAAVNAVSQHLFQRSGYPLESAADSLGAFNFGSYDHVGMVGYFPSLVTRLREQGTRLTVVELKSELVETADSFQVTLDPAALSACNKVLCTAATLLNSSLESVLGHCRNDAEVAVIGPTAGCLPDPLFCRGVDRVGAAAVVNPDILLARVAASEPWGNAVCKYMIENQGYPGYAALLDDCS